MKAFQGIRVLELGQIYNGPYCGLILAQLGAEVIKLEPLDGERLRYRSTGSVETHEFVMLNSNKESIALDIKSERGAEILWQLLSDVDVVIENYAPGTMARLGFDPADILKHNPRLVYASGKGYGTTGPYAGMAAMDITVQAMSGTIASTGQPDGPPLKAGPAFIDFSGGVHLYAAIVSALFQRERTGEGQYVEVSMHDTVYPMLASALGGLHNDPSNVPPERTGNRHSGLAVSPYNVYPASDGWLAIIAISDRHFHGVLKCAGLDHLATDPRFADRIERARNMDQLDAAISAWTATVPRHDLVAQLQANKVPCAPVLSMREVDTDPHLIERGMIRYVDHPVRGRTPVPGCALHLSASPVDELRPAPALGSATESVLQVLGLTTDDLEDLREQSVIR